MYLLKGFELRKIARSARSRSMESQAAAGLMRTGGVEVSRVDLRGLEGAGPRTNKRSIENVIASLDKSSFTAMQAIEPGQIRVNIYILLKLWAFINPSKKQLRACKFGNENPYILNLLQIADLLTCTMFV